MGEIVRVNAGELKFFDEKQFEAYRGLGNYIAKRLTTENMLHKSGDLEKLADKLSKPQKNRNHIHREDKHYEKIRV